MIIAFILGAAIALGSIMLGVHLATCIQTGQAIIPKPQPKPKVHKVRAAKKDEEEPWEVVQAP